MGYKIRSGCPVSFSMSSFGDKWSLLILREVIIRHKKYYDDILAMEEGISTNILADRLKDMEKLKLITKRNDPENKRRWIYEPTEKSLDLIPTFFELILWAGKHDPKTSVTSSHVDSFTKKRSQTIKQWRKHFVKETL
ncbi:MAG: winged helix-turn-helix transcriptional regulator [Gammaproteobacteria bacterium]|jgi:DNA-binding HxlR family transcriptional regulator